MDNGIIKINKSEVDLNKGLLMLKNHQSIEKSLDKVLHHISKSIIKKTYYIKWKCLSFL